MRPRDVAGDAPAWDAPPPRPTLAGGEIHVWRASLDRSAAEIARLEETLGDDERHRAARFRFVLHRERFIVGRGVLRTILGDYLGLAPETLSFVYGPQGKPALTDDTLRRGASDQVSGLALRFNLSHSEGMAVYAVAQNREVGIDIEHIRAGVVEEKIAERFFSAREAASLRALPLAHQPAAFFACWTRKEAFIKARGEGLSLPLDAFDVSLAPGEPPALLGIRGDPAELTRWCVHDLSVDVGYAAALVVEGGDYTLRCWQLK